MKLKKFLVLTTIVLFIIALMIAMPNTVSAEETMSAEYKKILNEEGKLVFNSIKPETKDDWYGYFEILYMYAIDGTMFSNVAEDLSSCNFTINYGKSNEETHNVQIVYNYDEKVKESVENIISKIPKDIEYFEVRDMELVNYWANNAGKDDTSTLSNYSGDLKKYIENSNIDFFVDVRAGGDGPFETTRVGVGAFRKDGIIYHINYVLGTKADHIIYVPDDTENTPEAIVAAAQKGIDEYLGEKGKVEVEYTGTVYDVWLETEYRMLLEYEPTLRDLTFEEFKASGSAYIPTYEKFEDVIGIKGIKEDDFAYCVNVPIDENMGDSYNVLILKDSSKMVKAAQKTTADMTTKIEISTTSKSLPLDTAIEVEKITTGEVFEKVTEVLEELKVEDHETFDLKLYSASTSEYIKKVDDGEFEVKLPIPERFAGKDLIVYHIDGEKVEEHEVKSEDGFAIFTTDHFSIYTLAEKQVANNDKEPENTPVNKGDKDNSPDTGTTDVIMPVLVVTIISILGIAILRKNK